MTKTCGFSAEGILFFKNNLNVAEPSLLPRVECSTVTGLAASVQFRSLTQSEGSSCPSFCDEYLIIRSVLAFQTLLKILFLVTQQLQVWLLA